MVEDGALNVMREVKVAAQASAKSFVDRETQDDVDELNAS